MKGTSGELLRTQKLNFGFYKLQKISSPGKEPLASQKNLPYAVSKFVRYEPK